MKEIKPNEIFMFKKGYVFLDEDGKTHPAYQDLTNTVSIIIAQGVGAHYVTKDSEIGKIELWRNYEDGDFITLAEKEFFPEVGGAIYHVPDNILVIENEKVI